MPRISNKRRAIKHLSRKALYSKLSEFYDDSTSSEGDFVSANSSEDLDSSTDEEDLASDILCVLQNTRYTDIRMPVSKDSDHFVTLLNQDEVRFQNEFRMTKQSFMYVHDLIAAHPVFQNNSRYSQVCIQKQLAVALFRFGHSGNSVSVGKTARKFGISEGSVELYTRRVIEALISLEPETVSWPNAEDRKATAARILENSGFPNCVGFVDGTLIKLATKPVKNGEDYFDRKRNYSFSVMLVCDDTKKVIYYSAGMFTKSCSNVQEHTK